MEHSSREKHDNIREGEALAQGDSNISKLSVNSLDSENYKGLLILHCKGRGKSLITAEKYLQEKLFIKVKKKKTK